MVSFENKVALVTGASSGVGRATAKALAAAGARVTAVARDRERLLALQQELPGLRIASVDVSAAETASRLLAELRPDMIVLAAGVTPETALLDEQTWEGFSGAWNTDLKAAFHFTKAALALPLAPGSTLVSLSSGAALNGSYLSGGYAGAKRMQWWLCDYAQKLSDSRKLELRFMAFLPKQLIAGTTIATVAASAYGRLLGISAEEYMKRFEVELDAEKVAAAILAALSHRVEPGVVAFGVTGRGIEPIS